MNTFWKLMILGSLLFPLRDLQASEGCCSWHGGPYFCDQITNTLVCRDGTVSPCSCAWNQGRVWGEHHHRGIGGVGPHGHHPGGSHRRR